jgi:predicted secreted protein
VNWATGIAVYVCIWWVVIFAVLPWGVRTAPPNQEGFDAGAPENPRLGLKVLVTTAISSLLWIGFYVLATSDLITFR